MIQSEIDGLIPAWTTQRSSCGFGFGFVFWFCKLGVTRQNVWLKKKNDHKPGKKWRIRMSSSMQIGEGVEVRRRMEKKKKESQTVLFGFSCCFFYLERIMAKARPCRGETWRSTLSKIQLLRRAWCNHGKRTEGSSRLFVMPERWDDKNQLSGVGDEFSTNTIWWDGRGLDWLDKPGPGSYKTF